MSAFDPKRTSVVLSPVPFQYARLTPYDALHGPRGGNEAARVPNNCWVAAVSWSLGARAQQAEPIRRVGVLLNFAEDDLEAQAQNSAFLQGLQQLGWTDGRNVRIDTRWTGGDPAPARKYTAELVALEPDVVLGEGTTVLGSLLQATRRVPIVFEQVTDPVGGGYRVAAIAAKKVTKTIPIVFAGVGDPVGAGVVPNLSHPSGNLTGVSLLATELSGKRLEEILKEIVPNAAPVAMFWNDTNPSMVLRAHEAPERR